MKNGPLWGGKRHEGFRDNFRRTEESSPRRPQRPLPDPLLDPVKESISMLLGMAARHLTGDWQER